MSSPIQPPEGAARVAATAPVPLSGSSAASAASPPAAIGSDPAVSVDTIPSTPPSDVLDEIADAEQAYSALQAQGLSVRYSYDAQTRRAGAELLDGAGNVVKTLTPSEAVALAGGQAPAQGA